MPIRSTEKSERPLAQVLDDARRLMQENPDHERRILPLFRIQDLRLQVIAVRSAVNDILENHKPPEKPQPISRQRERQYRWDDYASETRETTNIFHTLSGKYLVTSYAPRSELRSTLEWYALDRKAS